VHELGIAVAILERVEREAAAHTHARPVRVGVRIGELSGVDQESLAFGFEALVKNSALEPLTLEVEFCPRRYICRTCRAEFRVENYDLECPECGSSETRFAGGDELDIAYIEVEDL